MIQPAPNSIKTPADQKVIESQHGLPTENLILNESNIAQVKSTGIPPSQAISADSIISVQALELDSTNNLKEKMLIYFAVKASAGDLAEMLPNTKTFL
jgi:hypothetical protein